MWELAKGNEKMDWENIPGDEAMKYVGKEIVYDMVHGKKNGK